MSDVKANETLQVANGAAAAATGAARTTSGDSAAGAEVGSPVKRSGSISSLFGPTGVLSALRNSGLVGAAGGSTATTNNNNNSNNNANGSGSGSSSSGSGGAFSRSNSTNSSSAVGGGYSDLHAQTAVINIFSEVVKLLCHGLEPAALVEKSVLVEVLHRPNLLIGIDATVTQAGLLAKLIMHARQMDVGSGGSGGSSSSSSQEQESENRSLRITILGALCRMMVPEVMTRERLEMRITMMYQYFTEACMKSVLSRARLEQHASVDTEVQNLLDRNGASLLVIDLVMTSDDALIFDQAMQLGIALLENGNSNTQKSFFERLSDTDSTSFFSRLYDYMSRSPLNVRAEDDSNEGHAGAGGSSAGGGGGGGSSSSAGESSGSGAGYSGDGLGIGISGGRGASSGTGNVVDEQKLMVRILRFLQLLCENHNLDLQNFLRSQSTSKNKMSHNLVLHTLKYIDHYGLSLYINERNVGNITQALRTLAEFCQGPCAENQECLASHESNGLDIVIKDLLLNDFSKLKNKRSGHELSAESYLELKRYAAVLLISVIESRQQDHIFERILYSMDRSMLLASIQALYMVNSSSSDSADRQTNCTPPCACTLCNRDVGHQIYVLALTLAQYDKELYSMLHLDTGTADLDTGSALAYYFRCTDQIEIVRNNRLEKISFPISPVCQYLTEESRNTVYMETEVDEQNNKVPNFFERVNGLFEEMKWQRQLKFRPQLYWITTNYQAWRDFAFTFSLLLNVLVALYFPFDAQATSEFSHNQRWLAGLVLLLVTAALVFVWAKVLRQVRKQSKLGIVGGIDARVSKRSVTRYRVLITKVWLCAWTVFVISLGLLTLATRVLGLLQLLNAAVLLISYLGNHMSGYISDVDKAKTQDVLLYEVSRTRVFKDQGLIYQVLYTCICALGLIEDFGELGVDYGLFWYSLLLFDIVFYNPTLWNVIQSVTRNGKSIVLTGLFALILVYMFSIMGFVLFRVSVSKS
jgi:hypothetical protein